MHLHAQIAGLRLDALVFGDIGMDISTYMWSFSRVAPVQIQFWGHPVSSGVPHMDYFITSDVFEPTLAQSRFNEQLVRLDALSFYFFKPTVSKTDVVSVRQELGLEDAHLYLVPQSLMKFHPSFDTGESSLHSNLPNFNTYSSVLKMILIRDPSAQLLIVDHAGSPVEKTILRRRFAAVMDSSESSRILILPSMKTATFISLLAASDVLLDPFPFGGGVTTLEALAGCTPVVTAPALQTVPQLTAGMYRRMGWTPLIAGNVSDYVDIAFELASNATAQRHARESICARTPLLYEEAATKDEWERFLVSAVNGAKRNLDE